MGAVETAMIHLYRHRKSAPKIFQSLRNGDRVSKCGDLCRRLLTDGNLTSDTRTWKVGRNGDRIRYSRDVEYQSLKRIFLERE